MQRVPIDNQLEWLTGVSSSDGRTTGFDAGGWPASVWVLHAMYETETLPSGLTHDDVRSVELAAGVTEPRVVGDVNLDALPGMSLIGCAMGRSAYPGPAWRRLTWGDLAARLAHDPFAIDAPPCFRSFPYDSWPVNIQPPGEGSLDREQFTRLCEILAETSDGTDEVLAYYALLANKGWTEDSLHKGKLPAILAFYDDDTVFGSPSNIWPQDRSWLVWSDWDLWATKLSGSDELIDRLKRDPDLETIELPH